MTNVALSVCDLFIYLFPYISFHLNHNGSKPTQMLLLIMTIPYSQSVISQGGLFKLQMTSGYIKAANTSSWLHARPASVWKGSLAQAMCQIRERFCSRNNFTTFAQHHKWLISCLRLELMPCKTLSSWKLELGKKLYRATAGQLCI